MPDAALKKLTNLISAREPENQDTRRAAIVVAGALGTAKDRSLIQALLKILDDSDPVLREVALESLGRLQAEEALPRVIELVKEGGMELEAAVRTAGQFGGRGAKAMGRLMLETDLANRRRIAAALAQAGTGTAVLATAQALIDEDPGVVAAATRSLMEQLPTLAPAQRKHLAEQLLENLQPRNRKRLSPAGEAAILRVLAGLHDPRTKDVFWNRLDPSQPASVRAAALAALGSMPLPKNDKRIQQILACALEADFQVVAPALVILKQVEVKKPQLKHWLALLNASDVATRRFAVEKLKEVDQATVAQALLPQLHHLDGNLREAAIEALRSTRAGRRTMFDALFESTSPEECWALARAQAPLAKDLPSPMRVRLLKRTYALQDHDDRRAEPLWFLLREMDTAWVHKQIVSRALSLRKKKHYASSLSYWKLAARDPKCTRLERFELAATGLKLSDKGPLALARKADPALGQFARLVQEPDFDVVAHVAKAKWLDVEDLYYLGFYFTGEPGAGRQFGRKVLELVVKRSPRSDLGKNAKRKLKSEGLAGQK